MRITVCFTLLLLCGCASTQQVVKEKKSVEKENHYFIFYYDKTGFHTLDTKTNQRHTLLSFSGKFLGAKVSSDNKMAVSYTDNQSSCLSIINMRTSEVLTVKTVPSVYSFSFEWSQDGQYLCFGYAPQDNKKRKDNGGIFLISPDGKEKRNIDCRVSNIFKSWLPGNSFMVGFKKMLFVVDRKNCKTLYTIPGADMFDIKFSPDKTKFLYSQIELDFTNDKDGREMFALYISDYKGENIKRLISNKYDTRNAEWSPDGKKVICDIASLELEGIRHIALYNIVEDKVNFFQGDIFYDTEPSCTQPRWAPDGKKLLYHRTYKKDNKRYEHIVVKNLFPEKNRIITDCETDISKSNTTNFQPSALEWINDDIILFGTNEWTKIYTLIDNSSVTLKNGEQPLYIKPIVPAALPSALNN